jgi:hypothetical protein
VKRSHVVTAAFVAAVAVFAVLGLPPTRVALTVIDDGSVPGAVHVHTNRSDGRGSPDEVAAAAARAGLRFVVFTDHGDGTRPGDPPTYRAGVLCLDGVEISTAQGHYIAIDMPVSPYPLAGEARDVVEDVRRLGGFGVVAHPDSPKAELQWRAWDAPFDAIESLNTDTSWRLHFQRGRLSAAVRLAQAVLTYPMRPEETIASLLTSTADWHARLTDLLERRRVVVLAGSDAHAKLELRDVDPGDNRYSVPIPGYETVFRTMSIRVQPDQPLTGDAARDGALVVAAMRAGRVYTVTDGLASPPSFAFTAEHAGGVAREGDEVPAGAQLMLRVRSNAPAGFATRIRQGSRVLAGGEGPELSVVVAGEAGAYHAEIVPPGDTSQPAWIMSNPIYVRSTSPPATDPAPSEATAVTPLLDPGDTSFWLVEAAPGSRGDYRVIPDAEGGGLQFEYALAAGPAAGQFAALAVFTRAGLAPHDRVTFRTSADRPMRISVQIRASVTPAHDDRWRRSVYVDEVERAHTIFFDDMTPVGETAGRPRLQDAHSLVFVIELTHTKPGASGRLMIRDPALAR